MSNKVYIDKIKVDGRATYLNDNTEVSIVDKIIGECNEYFVIEKENGELALCREYELTEPYYYGE